MKNRMRQDLYDVVWNANVRLTARFEHVRRMLVLGMISDEERCALSREYETLISKMNAWDEIRKAALATKNPSEEQISEWKEKINALL